MAVKSHVHVGGQVILKGDVWMWTVMDTLREREREREREKGGERENGTE